METQNALLDSLFSNLTDGVCISDGKGKLFYMNRAAERMLGMTLEQARSVSLCERLCGHLSTGDCGNCAAHCALRVGNEVDAVTYKGRHGPTVSYDWRQLTVQREEKWRDLRVRCQRLSTPLFDSWEPDKHLTIIEDASAERELEQFKEEWREMVAHDLRSPMTNVYGTLRMIEELPEDKTLDATYRKLVSIAVRSCTAMRELLELYLDLAKFDARMMPVRLERVSLAQSARAAAESQSAAALEKSITLRVEADESLEASADRVLIERILANLLSNALKFTDPGGEVLLRARREQGRARLSVRDSGCGIVEPDLPKIFDPFYQSKSRREGRLRGTGLGLAFCRRAARAMAGEVSVVSTPKKGSEFTVDLPAVIPAPPAEVS